MSERDTPPHPDRPSAYQRGRESAAQFRLALFARSQARGSSARPDRPSAYQRGRESAAPGNQESAAQFRLALFARSQARGSIARPDRPSAYQRGRESAAPGNQESAAQFRLALFARSQARGSIARPDRPSAYQRGRESAAPGNQESAAQFRLALFARSQARGSSARPDRPSAYQRGRESAAQFRLALFARSQARGSSARPDRPSAYQRGRESAAQFRLALFARSQARGSSARPDRPSAYQRGRESAAPGNQESAAQFRLALFARSQARGSIARPDRPSAYQRGRESAAQFRLALFARSQARGSIARPDRPSAYQRGRESAAPGNQESAAQFRLALFARSQARGSIARPDRPSAYQRGRESAAPGNQESAAQFRLALFARSQARGSIARPDRPSAYQRGRESAAPGNRESAAQFRLALFARSQARGSSARPDRPSAYQRGRESAAPGNQESAAPSNYAELQVTTNFSFLRGASHADELVAQAKALGLAAIAIADRNTLAGVVRAHTAAKEAGLRLVVGARLDLDDAPSLLCLPTDRAAYGRLSRLVSLGQSRAEKGECRLTLADVAAHAQGQILIALAPETWDWREALSSPAHGLRREEPSAIAVEDRGSSSSGARGGGPSRAAMATFADELARVRAVLPVSATLHLALTRTYHGEDRARLGALSALAGSLGLATVATNDVLYHAPHRRPLQDVLTCIREHTTITRAGLRLEANAERHLKSPAEMARIFAGYEDAVRRTLEIVSQCRFSLDELVYEYPQEPTPPGKTPQGYLEEIAWEGAAWRFPGGLTEKVRATIARELRLIDELGFAPYFLTVYDIVTFARSNGILCQGRGSAANSAVCYCLGITAVNPVEVDLLFERFVSHARKEPPDIDVDFEHERREEVIQYIYARYGRDRAGLAATVISYRARSAVRDVGKAMGLSEDTVAALAGMVWGTRGGGALPEARVREAGLDPADPLLATVIELTEELIGFPRHLSQHVGGFVLTRGPLVEVVPVGNAAMADRTFIEWDKDDLAALGLLKIDVLALGMLTCIHRAFDLLEAHHGLPVSLASVPREDAAVYDMLCKADSLGVFQVESRAQMNMLPRLKPRCFYDLVIEVAIVRPGPIQGDMVHPYLRRRDGLEPETYPAPAPEHGPADELRQILGKTRGVPLFQEQAMRIAMDAAKFSDSEVNELRKAMATFRRRGTIGLLEEKMVSAMVERGYDPEFAQRCFNQIKGFGEYGFPESHAASFAHLVYVSSWLKCHYPAAFACALLNSQPMGFYAPAQIVRDAREHGVEARAVDVNHSTWDCTLEDGDSSCESLLAAGAAQVDGRRTGAGAQSRADRPVSGRWEKNVEVGFPSAASAAQAARPPGSSPSPRLRGEGRGEGQPRVAAPDAAPHPMTDGEKRCTILQPALPQPALRLGLRQIDGLRQEEAEKLVAARRAGGPFRDMSDLKRRARISPATFARLAAADAFRSQGLDRRQALWEVKGLVPSDELPLFAWSAAKEEGPEPEVELPRMALSEHVVNDYQTLRLSLKAHPMAFLRTGLDAERIVPCAALRAMKDGALVRVAGVVLVRQRPGSAKGVVFMTIEDETGVANTVVWPNALEKFRKVVMAARLVVVSGRIQRHQDIIHVVSQHLEDRSHWLARLAAEGPAMKVPIANADEVLRPDPGSAEGSGHPRWAGHPRHERIIPKSRDFH